jgi:hypothetical protein
MQRLRRAHFITRLVLVWLALTIGVAVAAPLVQPEAMQLVCSGSGAMKLLPQGDDTAGALAGHGLDCPLCISLDAPPPVALGAVLRLTTPAALVPPARAAPLASSSAAPPSARGPPLLRI